MSTGKVVGISFAALIGLFVLFFAIDMGTGYFGVFYTKTVVKAQQNANREVYEQTQSYVEGKRQELIKYHHEWSLAKDPADKTAIEFTVRQSCANLDESKITDPDMYDFLKYCKNH